MRNLICYFLVGFTVSISSCARELERNEYLRGPSPSLSGYQNNAQADAESETKVLKGFSERAGLGNKGQDLPEKTSDDWKLVVRAGMNVIDEQCEKYMDAIFWADRDLRTAQNQLNLTGTTTATLLGVFDASSEAIAATAAAFGLSTQGLANFSSSLLYEVEPSGIRKVVKRSQATYRLGVEQRMSIYNSRPAAVSAIQGYLSLCLPASIETQINEAVAASDFILDEENKLPNSTVPKLKRVVTEQVIRQELIDVITKGVEPTPVITELDRPKGCIADECNLNKSQAKQIQQALCLDTIDAVFGPNTRNAIADFEASKNTTLVAISNGQLEAKESDILIGVGPCAQPFNNALERFRYGNMNTNYRIPSPSLVKSLANTLKDAGAEFTTSVPETFNPDLRNAIGQVQQKLGLEQTKQVTKELLLKLQF